MYGYYVCVSSRRPECAGPLDHTGVSRRHRERASQDVDSADTRCTTLRREDKQSGVEGSPRKMHENARWQKLSKLSGKEKLLHGML
jgi:hypothetical protein